MECVEQSAGSGSRTVGFRVRCGGFSEFFRCRTGLPICTSKRADAAWAEESRCPFLGPYDFPMVGAGLDRRFLRDMEGPQGILRITSGNAEAGFGARCRLCRTTAVQRIRRGHDWTIETPPEIAVVCLGIPSALFYNCMIVRNVAQ